MGEGGGGEGGGRGEEEGGGGRRGVGRGEGEGGGAREGAEGRGGRRDIRWNRLLSPSSAGSTGRAANVVWMTHFLPDDGVGWGGRGVGGARGFKGILEVLTLLMSFYRVCDSFAACSMMVYFD